jgi:hypothetical protein
VIYTSDTELTRLTPSLTCWVLFGAVSPIVMGNRLSTMADTGGGSPVSMPCAAALLLSCPLVLKEKPSHAGT